MKQGNKNLDFSACSLGTLGASLLENLLKSAVMKAKIPGREANIHGRGFVRAGEGAIAVSRGLETVKIVQDF